MENKTECKIVQDLLISYVDDVLNKESKKMVESHLLECKRCQEKVKQIKMEIEKEDNQQKKEIDYLKKIRRQSRIKSFFMAILILAVIFVGWYLYQFCTIHRITKKIEKRFESENFYLETIRSCNEDTVMFQKTWYKEGKYKIEVYSQNEAGIKQMFETRYGNIHQKAKEEYLVNQEEKKARKEKMLFAKEKIDFIAEQSPFVLKHEPQSFIRKLGEPFYVKISTDHKQIGRKYYVFDFGETKKWVDIQTGLPIMSFADVVGTTYYTNTNIPKQEFKSISQYQYKFETVTDEDVQMPNLEEYKVEEFDWNNEVNRLLEDKP